MTAPPSMLGAVGRSRNDFRGPAYAPIGTGLRQNAVLIGAVGAIGAVLEMLCLCEPFDCAHAMSGAVTYTANSEGETNHEGFEDRQHNHRRHYAHVASQRRLDADLRLAERFGITDANVAVQHWPCAWTRAGKRHDRTLDRAVNGCESTRWGIPVASRPKQAVEPARRHAQVFEKSKRGGVFV